MPLRTPHQEPPEDNVTLSELYDSFLELSTLPVTRENFIQFVRQETHQFTTSDINAFLDKAIDTFLDMVAEDNNLDTE